MASEIPTGSLTLQAGTFRRITRATHEGSFRAISISNCSVTHWVVSSDDETRARALTPQDILDHGRLGGRIFRADDRMLVTIKEGKLLWKDDPEKIGTLTINMANATNMVDAFVLPDTFALFWIAAGAADGASALLKSC